MSKEKIINGISDCKKRTAMQLSANPIKNNNLKVRQVSTHEPKLEDAFLKIIEGGGKDQLNSSIKEISCNG